MTDEPIVEPHAPASGGEGEDPPPPFEPDEDLITYLERGREAAQRRSRRRPTSDQGLP